MSRDSARRTQNFVLISTGAACVLLGGMVLAGWWLGIAVLTRLAPFSSPMAFNTAVAFVLDGLALLAISAGRPWGALPGGSWSIQAGVMTLAEYGFAIELRIDKVLLSRRILEQPGHPDRVAPNTA